MNKYCRFQNIPNDNRYSLFVRQKTFDIYSIENGVKRVPWIYLLKELKCAVLSDIPNFFFFLEYAWNCTVMTYDNITLYVYVIVIMQCSSLVCLFCCFNYHEIPRWCNYFIRNLKFCASSSYSWKSVLFSGELDPDVRRIVKLVPFFLVYICVEHMQVNLEAKNGIAIWFFFFFEKWSWCLNFKEIFLCMTNQVRLSDEEMEMSWIIASLSLSLVL